LTCLRESKWLFIPAAADARWETWAEGLCVDWCVRQSGVKSRGRLSLSLITFDGNLLAVLDALGLEHLREGALALLPHQTVLVHRDTKPNQRADTGNVTKKAEITRMPREASIPRSHST